MSDLNKSPHLRARMINVDVPSDAVEFIGVNNANKPRAEKAPRPVIDLSLSDDNDALTGEFSKHHSHVYGR